MYLGDSQPCSSLGGGGGGGAVAVMIDSISRYIPEFLSSDQKDFSQGSCQEGLSHGSIHVG